MRKKAIFFIFLFLFSFVISGKALAHNTFPSYTQDGFWFLDDDATSANAEDETGFGAGNTVENTNITNVAKNSVFMLRMDVSETANQDQSQNIIWRLEYKLASGASCSDASGWTQVTTSATNAFQVTSASSITETYTTQTDRISTNTSTFQAGKGNLLDTSVTATQLLDNKSGETQWAIQATTNASASTAYIFRVSDGGTALNSYTRCPQATIATDTSLTFIVSTDNFPDLTPGNPVFATTTLSVDTNNSTGWYVTLSGDDKTDTDSVMDLNGEPDVGITDQTEWIPGVNTTTPGNAVRILAFDNVAAVLAFRVMTASGSSSFISTDWWGLQDSYIDNDFTGWAGIASSTAANLKIGESSVSSGGGPVLNTVLYYLDVPKTQKTGTYSGGITFTATMNP